MSEPKKKRTVNLSYRARPAVIRAAKVHCALSEISLTRFVEDAMVEKLERDGQPAAKRALKGG